MRILSWLLGLPLAALVVLFALSNREGVAIGLWPFGTAIALPLSLALLVALLLGLVLGLVLGLLIAGFATLRARMTARVQARRAAGLERDLAVARAAAPLPPDNINPTLNLPLS